MAVHWKPSPNKASCADRYATGGGTLPTKPVTERGKRRAKRRQCKSESSKTIV